MSLPSPKRVKPNQTNNEEYKKPPEETDANGDPLIGKSAEELGEAFGLSLLTYMKTDEECAIAGKAFMGIVTGEYLAED